MTLTPGALAVRLSVSDRTVRRLADAYSKVYGQLPRNRRQHRQFPPEAVLLLDQAAELMRDAPGSSTVEILTALRDGLTSAHHARRPAILTTSATPDALGSVMDELRALRTELADLRALVITLQPSRILPTSQLLVQAPEPSDQDQPSTAAVLAEPMPDQLEAPTEVNVDPPALVLSREPELQANHAGLLERLNGGGRLVHRGQQQFEELNADNTQRGPVDRRTVKSLVNSKRLKEIDGAMRLTPAAVAQLDARSRSGPAHRTP